MIEITGELWDYYGRDGFVVCITTNGFVKADGNCVMGRGCAREARDRFKGLAHQLGGIIRAQGNYCHWLITPGFTNPVLMSFPTKHNWWEESDIELIKQSAYSLSLSANQMQDYTFILPRPGCANGGLKWEAVKPAIESILPDNVWAITK